MLGLGGTPPPLDRKLAASRLGHRHRQIAAIVGVITIRAVDQHVHAGKYQFDMAQLLNGD
ncbi:hypothetical protein PK98_01810 [Croceibacterium mercuriale]|uniref:Uncharacterized protein n=1 Tax=Croceibacterium mercuriale TaxID=1572751 RepID=A0A0B2BVJ1_9SPHN|nr:hypothetical protein [Croceibacterium mercuriale]KHL25459.1 hypothetical protein PK98_01810 [Croceibacterium mercuriale]